MNEKKLSRTKYLNTVFVRGEVPYKVLKSANAIK